MASRVLLVSTNRCVAPDPVFPLGLAHLNAALKRAGHETRWLDFVTDPPALEKVLGEFQPELVGISLRNIDDVLIRKQETYFDDLPSLCRQIQGSAHCPVVLGGSGFSIFPRELMEVSGADYGIAGAGEVSLLRLIEALEAGRQPGGVAGLLCRGDGETAVPAPAGSVPQARLADGDIPRAEAAHYLRTAGMLNVQTQRGCAFQCCYCTYPVIEGRAHRRRDAEDVAEEFAHAASLGAKYMFIVDSVFNSSVRHVHEICEALLRRNLKISWSCFLRPQGLTRELVRLMARAGLSHVEFGTDSFCDEVLASYRKGFTFDEVRESSELMRQEEVDYCHFLISGGPGETRETLRRGYENAQQLVGAVIMAVVGMRIYPGTQLGERAVAEGVIERGASLLNPKYYLAPGLDAETVFAQLREFARQSPNWIVGDPAPAYTSLVARLRSRGVVGPLWSYLSMIQRLWPHGFNPQYAPSAA